jgi:hypothetical protein
MSSEEYYNSIEKQQKKNTDVNYISEDEPED